ncbi:hypothetical protein EFO61_04700 [Lacticaseibacillus rhamnosus]|nr:hypothetical protein [Lacticaseibacillus rhamnosus]MBU5978238.1 hypothetical protein [Lacticaseibacillus rhamnosus]MCT3145632.1 hypothetical protein [Lacticaseibacillus rhamnosus]MCT3152236.1 hypothetical protein [Lacticaseibacillus rhamnosus]MCT3161288.1 hypothetical protein [Lacticaseibacillus rhamnosus]
MITMDNLIEQRELLWQTTAPVFQYRHQRQFVLDIDSTHLDTCAHQEKMQRCITRTIWPRVIIHKLSVKKLVRYWMLGGHLAIIVLTKMPISFSSGPLSTLKHWAPMLRW